MKKLLLATIALLGVNCAAYAETNYVDQRGMEYEYVAAGQTAQALGTTGAAGDTLARVTCSVATAATSNVAIKDGADTAITIIPANVGGGVGVLSVDLGITSVTGAWQITTGAGVTCLAIGRFTD